LLIGDRKGGEGDFSGKGKGLITFIRACFVQGGGGESGGVPTVEEEKRLEEGLPEGTTVLEAGLFLIPAGGGGSLGKKKDC